MKQGLSWEHIKFSAVQNWPFTNPEKLISLFTRTVRAEFLYIIFMSFVFKNKQNTGRDLKLERTWDLLNNPKTHLPAVLLTPFKNRNIFLSVK